MQVGFESDVAIFPWPRKWLNGSDHREHRERATHQQQGDEDRQARRTGVEINVPSFVDIGTVVRIDTETGEYLDRVKK
ncbi:MAG: hypothetical protein IPP33_06140 [Flavobacteriales bacterium]|nr:hypothetical protein [Flavobacteriales bacterium]